ncbi:hypothetical protein ACA910_008366 [Epithemia clementina (nom. ined.)]
MNGAKAKSKLYFCTVDVLRESTFFWVGRGGHGVKHPGNKKVRIVIASRSAEYQGLERSERGRIPEELLRNELRNVKFVIPRDAVISKITSDRKNTTSKTDDADSRDKKNTALVGASRLKSLLQTHKSMDHIRSYPDGVCIEVGYKWKLDILKHLLREDEAKRRNKRSAGGTIGPECPKKGKASKPVSMRTESKKKVATGRLNRRASKKKTSNHPGLPEALYSVKQDESTNHGPSQDATVPAAIFCKTRTRILVDQPANDSSPSPIPIHEVDWYGNERSLLSHSGTSCSEHSQIPTPWDQQPYDRYTPSTIPFMDNYSAFPSSESSFATQPSVSITSCFKPTDGCMSSSDDISSSEDSFGSLRNEFCENRPPFPFDTIDTTSFEGTAADMDSLYGVSLAALIQQCDEELDNALPFQDQIFDSQVKDDIDGFSVLSALY